MAKLTIDGKTIEAQDGQTLLDVCRENNIPIPTLCSHESLEPSGACRLCVVEVKHGKRTRIVTSCLYPAADGLIVDTQSERVRNVRKLVLQLLLARCPQSETIRDLAREMGIEPEPRFTPDDYDGTCILCRMCVRTCEKIVGVSAIGFSYRGPDKTVGTPFKEDSAVCIGCGACVYVCPTGHIAMEEDGDTRTVWGRTFQMTPCKVCGRYFAPADQLKYISDKTGKPLEELQVCVSCK